MSDNDFGSLTEFFNSLVGALNDPQDVPELAELIEQALDADAALGSRAAAASHGSERQAKAKKPANLGEHLVAAVGKAEEIIRGETDGGGEHTDASRGDKGNGGVLNGGIVNGGIAAPSSGGSGSSPMSRSRLFTNSRRHTRRAGQRVAAQLIQTIAKAV